MPDNQQQQSTTPFIGPDGAAYDVPTDNVQQAVAQGGKIAQDIVGPDGATYAVPLDNVHAAIRAGGQLKPPQMPTKYPEPEYESSKALEEAGATTVPRMPHTLSPAAAETAGAIAAGGAGVVAGMEAVPPVLAHTTEGVKALGEWASKNPMQAYLLFQVIKEFIPGAKKAIGFIKGSPDVPPTPQ